MVCGISNPRHSRGMMCKVYLGKEQALGQPLILLSLTFAISFKVLDNVYICPVEPNTHAKKYPGLVSSFFTVRPQANFLHCPRRIIPP